MHAGNVTGYGNLYGNLLDYVIFGRADLLRLNNHWHLSAASKAAGCGTSL